MENVRPFGSDHLVEVLGLLSHGCHFSPMVVVIMYYDGGWWWPSSSLESIRARERGTIHLDKISRVKDEGGGRGGKEEGGSRWIDRESCALGGLPVTG